MPYMDGTEVREGDVVAIRHDRSNSPGVVLKVLLPGTKDAKDWSLPKDGLLFKSDAYGLFVAESLEEDEDIVFVRKGDDQSPETKPG
jgi:hypothetical protein